MLKFDFACGAIAGRSASQIWLDGWGASSEWAERGVRAC